jgi:hypothetical protein
MTTISEALVLAVQYIADRDESSTEDDDAEMLERLAALLQNANEKERSSLLKAAKDLNLPEWPGQIGLAAE